MLTVPMESAGGNEAGMWLFGRMIDAWTCYGCGWNNRPSENGGLRIVPAGSGFSRHGLREHVSGIILEESGTRSRRAARSLTAEYWTRFLGLPDYRPAAIGHSQSCGGRRSWRIRCRTWVAEMGAVGSAGRRATAPKLEAGDVRNSVRVHNAWLGMAQRTGYTGTELATGRDVTACTPLIPGESGAI